MPCCATGPCGRDDEPDPGPGLVLHEDRYVCWLCYVMPRMFPPIVRCPNTVKEVGTQCALVKGHPRWVPCQSSRDGKAEQATRDGDPKLAAERKRDPTFEKRQRAGPNWVPPARRV